MTDEERPPRLGCCCDYSGCRCTHSSSAVNRRSSDLENSKRLADELDAAKTEVGRMLEAFHHEAQNHRRALLATEVEAKKRYAAEDEVERLRELLGTALRWWEAHAENYAEQMDKPICDEEAAAIEAVRNAANSTSPPGNTDD